MLPSSANVTEADIRDRSKADAFTKIFAIVQCSWLVIQSIARAASGLSITQLELTTLAFVFCSLITYILWWDKPFDAERGLIVACSPPSERVRDVIIRQLGRSLHEDGAMSTLRISDLTWRGLWQLVMPFDATDYANPFGILYGDPDTEPWRMFLPSVTLYATGTVSSALHLAAWNWEFPDPVVQILWRAFGIAALGASLLPLLSYALAQYKLSNWMFVERAVDPLGIGPGRLTVQESGVSDSLAARVAVWFLFASYIISRLVLLSLTFYCFSSMPLGAYEKVDWMSFIPHFS